MSIEDRGGDYVKVQIEIYVRTDWHAKNVAAWYRDSMAQDICNAAGTVFPFIHDMPVKAERLPYDRLPAEVRKEVDELEQEFQEAESEAYGEVVEEGATGIEEEDKGGPFFGGSNA